MTSNDNFDNEAVYINGKKSTKVLKRASIFTTIIAMDEEHCKYLVSKIKFPKGFTVDASRPAECKYQSGSYKMCIFCFYTPPNK